MNDIISCHAYSIEETLIPSFLISRLTLSYFLRNNESVCDRIADVRGRNTVLQRPKQRRQRYDFCATLPSWLNKQGSQNMSLETKTRSDLNGILGSLRKRCWEKKRQNSAAIELKLFHCQSNKRNVKSKNKTSQKVVASSYCLLAQKLASEGFIWSWCEITNKRWKALQTFQKPKIKVDIIQHF